MPEEEENPYAPPKAELEEKVETNPYWGGPTLLDRYSSLGIRGKFALHGIVLLALSGVGYLCGVIFWKAPVAGVVLLFASWLIPKSLDD